MDLDLLRKHVESGIVNEMAHPTLPLKLYNYSARCQYEKAWDEVTLRCRGFVMCGETVVARPFRKFFNDTEHEPEEIPWHLPSEITEKMDGSLLIVFHFGGEWHACTRGSFVSDQAKEGLRILHERYGTCDLDTECTYLFEVIYPENRIVVDYGNRRDVVLLGIMGVADDLEYSIDYAPAGLTKVRRLPSVAQLIDLRSIITDAEEGYVVRFDNGFRMKVKGERYLQLHRILSGISSRSVWEYLSQSLPFDEMLELVPDEFATWVRIEKRCLIESFNRLNRRTEEAYMHAKRFESRKDQAAVILTDYADVASATFAALDGKPTAAILWKKLYPEFRRPTMAERIESEN